MARYGALLDACALVPIVLADTLLRIAERGLYRPLWSRLILDEAQDAVLAVHPGLDPEAVTRRFQYMDDTFEDALVTGWEPLLDGIDLPDPDDRHVLAAAMRGGAQAIVTFNLKDFPQETLALLDIAAVHPDTFLLDQLTSRRRWYSTCSASRPRTRAGRSSTWRTSSHGLRGPVRRGSPTRSRATCSRASRCRGALALRSHRRGNGS